MIRKIMTVFAVITAAALCVPLTVYARSWNGFEYSGSGYTDTKNEYFFETVDTCLILNKELDDAPDYDDILAGSDIYVPVRVYPDHGKVDVPATDKMIKEDKVEVSYKVISGADYIGEVTLIDAKKLKSSGLPAGIYAHIPVMAYDKTVKTRVNVMLVLSVNGVSYQETRVSLIFDLINRIQYIDKNSVYGAETPTQFKVSGSYDGTATFDFGNNIKYTAKVAKTAAYYLDLSREPVESIANMYSDAYLEFYDFKGNKKTFASKGKLEIPVNRGRLAANGEEASLYAYKIDGDTLTALGGDSVSFDTKTNKLTIHTKTLGQYVLSNRALMKTVDESTDDILKSGYASEVLPETEEVASTSGQSSSSSASSAASSTASSSTAAEPSQSSSEASADTASYNGDGYAPEEPWNNPNQNVSTGMPINADNPSADNPSTADLPLLPLSFAGAVCSALAVMASRRRAY